MIKILRLIAFILLAIPAVVFGDGDENNDPTPIMILQGKDYIVIIETGKFSCMEGQHKSIKDSKVDGIQSGCSVIGDDGEIDILYDNGKSFILPPITNFYPDIDENNVTHRDPNDILRKPQPFKEVPSLVVKFRKIK